MAAACGSPEREHRVVESSVAEAETLVEGMVSSSSWAFPVRPWKTDLACGHPAVAPLLFGASVRLPSSRRDFHADLKP